MRLNAWNFFAVTLLIFGQPPDGDDGGSRLLHTEVVEVMAPGGCAITAELAKLYLLPTIDGSERVAYVCHSAMRERDLAEMQARAAADNAARAAKQVD